MGLRTTHITSQKVDCWIDGGNFVSSRSSDYPDMIHSKRDISSCSLFQKNNNQFSTTGDGRGDIGPRTTNFSSQKVGFVRYTHDMGFIPSQIYCIETPVTSSCSRGYSVNDTGGY